MPLPQSPTPNQLFFRNIVNDLLHLTEQLEKNIALLLYCKIWQIRSFFKKAEKKKYLAQSIANIKRFIGEKSVALDRNSVSDLFYLIQGELDDIGEILNVQILFHGDPPSIKEPPIVQFLYYYTQLLSKVDKATLSIKRFKDLAFLSENILHEINAFWTREGLYYQDKLYSLQMGTKLNTSALVDTLQSYFSNMGLLAQQDLCVFLIIHLHTQDLGHYAATWIRHLRREGYDLQRQEKEHTKWSLHFDPTFANRLELRWCYRYQGFAEYDEDGPGIGQPLAGDIHLTVYIKRSAEKIEFTGLQMKIEGFDTQPKLKKLIAQSWLANLELASVAT